MVTWPGLADSVLGTSALLEKRGRRSSSSINRVTAHDGFTLMDVVSYDHKHNEANGEDNNDGHSHNLSWGWGAEGPTDDPAIIALATYESPTSLKTIIDLNAHGVVSKPLRALGILTQFALARYRHGYEGRLNNKVRKLEETLKGRRLIEKAIRILAGTNGIDEDQAYRLVRDQATEKRITMVSVAEAIIAAHETMNGLGLTIAPSKNE